VATQALEVNFDAGASGVEVAAALNRRPQMVESESPVAHHDVSAGEIIPRERIVGPLGQAFLKTFRNVLESFAGVLQVPLPHVGARQLLIDFDQRSFFERMVALTGEDNLAVKLRDRVVVTAPQVIDVTEPRIGADDLNAFVAPQVLLLSFNR